MSVQIPVNARNKNTALSDEEAKILSNRRAGIEPLIGHTKQGGQLGRSRMRMLLCKEELPLPHF